MGSEVEEIVSRLAAQPGVIGVLVLDKDGRSLRSTLAAEETSKYAPLISDLADKARSTAASMEAGNEMSFLRLRTNKAEILLVPDPVKGYITALLQNPHGDHK